MSTVPAVGYYDNCWRNTLDGIAAAMDSTPDMTRLLSTSATWIDALIGPRANSVFCPHAQLYFYAD